jgi:CHASE3 domain sensor protein
MDAGLAMELVLPLVKMILFDWEEKDIEIYFELAYRDSEMELYVKTTSSRAANVISNAVANRMAHRISEEMKLLRNSDHRRLTNGNEF